MVSIVPKPGKIFSIKKGSKISRIFRHVFSHNKINKFLGINLAALFLSSALTQTPVSVQGKESDSPLTEVPIVLQTKHGVQYPVKQIKITQGYRLFHPGLDLDGKTGDPIYPIMAGRVEAIDRSKYGYGNAIILNHGNDITSLYAHLSRIEVSVNQDVTVDTEIGKMGATGRASGDHLHLEIRDHGKAINPLTILSR
ncbi:hypothetical protein A3A76_02035 [Candidatus Woesebacteria bacterium RIFCSPLOWO2_01_FULL_39_23]|nr:MAG: hypothetical protein A2141_03180 [Candidatus Woesebacteria bacterium RBG_16_40_11]OGM37965.1 MAG: hypothetical protein A3E41_03545 [Candidatus Woesebacteria bacterium RIFCSPHIGHO2_12_FULL_38_9]OGM62337.1 MAG: hypothetical protein A3A76_02035 [Candidatus Woesebacteria bacterium RIFCSPLOWO2_01_FULL_39_23]